MIQGVGLLCRIRGMQHLTQDGETIRPDCFLGDDLQTDQSARSVEQCQRRESVLNGAVRNLAGPGKQISGLVAITVQLKGDLADRLLNRDLNPQWHGRAFSLVEPLAGCKRAMGTLLGIVGERHRRRRRSFALALPNSIARTEPTWIAVRSCLGSNGDTSTNCPHCSTRTT